MKEISNTDYSMITRLLPILLEGIGFSNGARKYEAARQLGNMLKKWKHSHNDSKQ